MKRALALSTLILGVTSPWVKGEGAEAAQDSSALDREKVAIESSSAPAPLVAGKLQQATGHEVLTVLEKEFGIRARLEDLEEEGAAKRLSAQLAAVNQLRSAKKDEFETTAEFQARRAGLVSSPVLDGKQIILLPQSANSTYDADSEILRVDLPLMLFWGPADVERSRRTVRTTSERPIILRGPADAERPNDATACAFAGDFPKDYFGDAVSLVDLKIPRDRARQLKANLKLLVLARPPSPEAPAEEWATESGKSLRLIPTAILAFSAADGAVVHRQILRPPAGVRIWATNATIQDWLDAPISSREEFVNRRINDRKKYISPTEFSLAVAFSVESGMLKPEESIAKLGIFRYLPAPTSPIPVFQTRPKYPFLMRQAGISGEVVVSFRVREDGSVDDITVVRSSRKEFESAAKECIAKWRFKPASIEGRPVSTRLQMPFSFTLNEE